MFTRIACLAAFLVAGLGTNAMAEDQIKLFRVISPKDDVTIGVTATELQGLAGGSDVEKLARHLVADGQMTVWQYAVRHAKDGSLEQGPLRQVSILKNDTLRIEPYATTQHVAAPEK
jgi:hypothetical protein